MPQQNSWLTSSLFGQSGSVSPSLHENEYGIQIGRVSVVSKYSLLGEFSHINQLSGSFSHSLSDTQFHSSSPKGQSINTVSPGFKMLHRNEFAVHLASSLNGTGAQQLYSVVEQFG